MKRTKPTPCSSKMLANLDLFIHPWTNISHEGIPVTKSSLKIPKKHPFHSQCAFDLGQVFRSEGDHSMKRTKPTPCSSKMLANLDLFIHPWTNISHEGIPVTKSS